MSLKESFKDYDATKDSDKKNLKALLSKFDAVLTAHERVFTPAP